jgi:hypothetical protein
MNPSEIEHRLRAAPQPRPPTGLRERLIAQIRTPARGSIRRNATGGGWRRWWPALAPAAVSAACALVLTLHHLEMNDLKDTIQALTNAGNPAAQVPAAAVGDSTPAPVAQDAGQDDLARLRETASQLRAEIARLEQLQEENNGLRAQLAAPSPGTFTAEEQAAMDTARERAQSINCVNNLKQIGLAARVWGLDNGDVYSPDFLSMSNELSTPRILVCPGDTNRPVAADWASFTSANCSYEYLAPNGSPADPTRVLARCPIHGNIGLCDGSVQQRVAKDHPEWLVQRDGKLYLETSDNPRAVRQAK